MTFQPAELERAKNKDVSLTFRYQPSYKIRGRLIAFEGDRLFLQTDTVTMVPEDAPKPAPDSEGRTPVLFNDISGAAL